MLRGMHTTAGDLKQLDPLNDILRPRVVEAVTSLDGSTIWRLRQRREFPEPIRLSPGRVGYRRSDIEQWLASRGAR